MIYVSYGQWVDAGIVGSLWNPPASPDWIYMLIGVNNIIALSQRGAYTRVVQLDARVFYA